MGFRKNILITGGTSGVGLAIARSLAKEPVNVILLGRNQRHANLAINELKSNKATYSYYLCDLTNEIERRNVIAKIAKDFKEIHTLFDCFGVYPKDKIINVRCNLTAHYFFISEIKKYFTLNCRIWIITGLPAVVKNCPIIDFQGTIINRALWEITYKTLLVSLLAGQLKREGIIVNGFFPGHIKSNLRPQSQKNVQTSLDIAKELVFSNSFSSMTNALFDFKGQQIPIKPNKYSYERAQRLLKKYLPL